MSTRDIEAALTETLEVEGVSKSTVSNLCGQLKHDFERWQNRDLSDVDLLYLFCDGIYLRLRTEDSEAAAVLCAYGSRLMDGRCYCIWPLGTRKARSAGRASSKT